jgi:hypothetical protein
MKPFAWSFSSLSNFENCPKQFYHTRVAKDVATTQGEAALWGDRVHQYLEAGLHYAKGNTAEAAKILSGLYNVPEDIVVQHAAIIDGGPDKAFAGYWPYVEAIMALPHDEVLPEQQFALNRALAPCDWFAEDVWCRGIVDVLLIRGSRAYALDWKTGKRKPDSQQLRLFALLVFAHYPHVQECKTEFVWLKTGERDDAVYRREQEAEMWQPFLPSLARYNAAFKQEMWAPRKSGLCRGWCPVTSCEFWSPKK